jgi:hypothetical protein
LVFTLLSLQIRPEHIGERRLEAQFVRRLLFAFPSPSRPLEEMKKKSPIAMAKTTMATSRPRIS